MKAVFYNQRDGGTERPCAEEPHRAPMVLGGEKFLAFSIKTLSLGDPV